MLAINYLALLGVIFAGSVQREIMLSPDYTASFIDWVVSTLDQLKLEIIKDPSDSEMFVIRPTHPSPTGEPVVNNITARELATEHRDAFLSCVYANLNRPVTESPGNHGRLRVKPTTASSRYEWTQLDRPTT